MLWEGARQRHITKLLSSLIMIPTHSLQTLVVLVIN